MRPCCTQLVHGCGLCQQQPAWTCIAVFLERKTVEEFQASLGSAGNTQGETERCGFRARRFPCAQAMSPFLCWALSPHDISLGSLSSSTLAPPRKPHSTQLGQYCELCQRQAAGACLTVFYEKILRNSGLYWGGGARETQLETELCGFRARAILSVLHRRHPLCAEPYLHTTKSASALA